MNPRVQDRTLVYDTEFANSHDPMVWLGDAGLSFMLDQRCMFPSNYESGQALAWADHFSGENPGLVGEPL